jgi:RsiW-degrading membrane proteinase PrsW (M82 family)
VQTTYSGGDELSRVERVAHNRNGLWVAIAITLVGLLAFTIIFNFILPNFGDNLSGISLILVGLVFSAIPALIWLYLFYRLDRLEAEPKTLVLGVFFIGVLVTAAFHDFLINEVFDVDSWQYTSWWAHLLGGILVVGVIEQFIVWATVRYVVFRNPEFDERVDGVIYSVAAGLGLATVLNFHYVFRSNGVDLDIGSIRMVINAMAYASFAGIMGYFIGQVRFEKTPVYYMPAGLALAAVFNGVFWYLLDRTFGAGLRYNPWGDLILATIIAAISLAIVFWLIERANEETLRLAHRNIRQGVGGSPVAPPAPLPVPADAPATTTSAESASTDMPALAGNTAMADSSSQATSGTDVSAAPKADDTSAAPDSQEKA